MEIREILEDIIREEIAKEFGIPVICPPNNRVEDNICDKFLSKIQDAEMPQREDETKLCKCFTADVYINEEENLLKCRVCGKQVHSKTWNACYNDFLAYHLRKMSELLEACKNAFELSCNHKDCRAISHQVNHDYCLNHKRLLKAISKAEGN